jgi:isocitrate dehydrogenase
MLFKNASRNSSILVNLLIKNGRRYATKSKVLVEKPIVEIDGDEMTKLIFDEIKQKLLFPFVQFQRDYYDCSLTNR